MKEYAKRILWILSNEKVKYEKEFILKKIKTFYPDFRKCINELEKYAIDGEIIESNVEDITIAQDIFDKVRSDTTVYDLRSFILSNHDKFSSDYEYLTELIFNLVCKSDIPEGQKAKILIELSDCIKNYSSVINPEINFSAAMLKIREII
jgi:DNA polymerase III delta prime subunit